MHLFDFILQEQEHGRIWRVHSKIICNVGYYEKLWSLRRVLDFVLEQLISYKGQTVWWWWWRRWLLLSPQPHANRLWNHNSLCRLVISTFIPMTRKPKAWYKTPPWPPCNSDANLREFDAATRDTTCQVLCFRACSKKETVNHNCIFRLHYLLSTLLFYLLSTLLFYLFQILHKAIIRHKYKKTTQREREREKEKEK